jgi:hypothetical protein
MVDNEQLTILGQTLVNCSLSIVYYCLALQNIQSQRDPKIFSARQKLPP